LITYTEERSRGSEVVELREGEREIVGTEGGGGR
jgi:hypothetical protein